MKIGVIKLGARITWDTDGAVAPGEAISICKALKRGGAEVHVFTKLLKKDTLDPSLTWHDITEDHNTTGLDLLVIINGNVNFFGGAEDFIGQLQRLKCLGGCLVTGADVGVDFLGLGAPGLLHGVEIGIGLKTEQFKRAQFVAAAGAIARTTPAVIGRFAVTVIGLTLAGFALGGSPI